MFIPLNNPEVDVYLRLSHLPDWPIYKITNYLVKSSDSVPIEVKRQRNSNHPYGLARVSGKSFVIHVDKHITYFHFLVDSVLQYLFLKKYIPDLRMILLHSFEDEQMEGWRWNLAAEIAKLFSINEEDILRVSGQDIFFEEIYAMMFFHLNPIKAICPTEPRHLHPWDHDMEDLSNPHRIILTESVAELYKIIPKDDLVGDTPAKIFVSRASRYNELSSNWLLRRSLSPEENEELENGFNKMGYEIVTLEGMSLIQQIRLYHNATHIAGLKGTSFINILFCKEYTNVIALNPDNAYRIYYDYIGKYFKLNYLEIPDLGSVAAVPPGEEKVMGNEPDYEAYSVSRLLDWVAHLPINTV